MARNCEGWEDVGRGERSLIRSDRPPEDRRPIEGLTSKPRPNSEPALLFFFFECHWAPTARFIFLPSANSPCARSLAHRPPEPACACLVPALRLEPAPRRLRPHCSCPAREEPRVCTAASSFRAEWLQPVPRPTDCRTLDDVLRATEGAYQRITESRGAPAVPHHFERVGSRRTGCSNSHRFSSPAFPRFGCSLLLCVSFHC